jgi:hypothetical protein
MAAGTPEVVEIDDQDQTEVFDETHLDEDSAEFLTLEEAPDVFDATRALGDGRDVLALDAADLDPDALDDEDLETDEDVDDTLEDDLEDEREDDGIEDEDPDDEDAVDELEWDEADIETVADLDQSAIAEGEEPDEYESEELTDEELRELGYADEADGKDQGGSTRKGRGKPGGRRPEDVPDEVNPHQDELLDEGVEETFPASDPVSVKRIT